MDTSFSKSKTIKGKPPSLPFEMMKNKILGKKYELSLVFIGDHLSKKLNNKYRNKNTSTNILSFPIENDSGEIFINLNQSKKDASCFKKSYNDFVRLLFIHGCLHLVGYKHGKKMEIEEIKMYKELVH